MTGTFAVLATFLASSIEGTEMMAILVGVGATRGWRSTLFGAAAGFAFLTGLIFVLQTALLTFPIQQLRLVVGALLLILGLQWLKKALLRIARPGARKKTAEISETGLRPESQEKIDWYAFVIAFKGVLLEGLEIAFIVATFGAEAHEVGLAAAGAVAALVVVAVIAFLIRGWLSRIPREWLRFGVGLLLAAFGTFWAAEGALVRWPGGDLALIGLMGVMTATAFAYLALLRHTSGARNALHHGLS
jgi:uncharacterized membrane protein